MGRAFREAMVALWRTGAVGAVSAVAVGASLLLVGLFIQIIDAAQGVSATVKDRVEVEAYLKDSTTRRSAQSIADEIARIEGVSEVTYVDKRAAAEEFSRMFGSDLLSALSTNPLPASIRVGFDPEGDVTTSARTVVAAIEGRKEIESVDGGEAWLSGLDRALEIATGLVTLLGIVLCVASAFAVSNTSKLMVLAQREAIEVMRLVGATAGFVRGTFLIGGALQGMIGGVLAAIGIVFSSSITGSWFLAEASISQGSVAMLMIVLGFCLGVIGSWTSLNRVLQAISS